MQTLKFSLWEETDQVAPSHLAWGIKLLWNWFPTSFCQSSLTRKRTAALGPVMKRFSSSFFAMHFLPDSASEQFDFFGNLSWSKQRCDRQNNFTIPRFTSPRLLGQDRWHPKSRPSQRQGVDQELLSSLPIRFTSFHQKVMSKKRIVKNKGWKCATLAFPVTF